MAVTADGNVTVAKTAVESQGPPALTKTNVLESLAVGATGSKDPQSGNVVSVGSDVARSTTSGRGIISSGAMTLEESDDVLHPLLCHSNENAHGSQKLSLCEECSMRVQALFAAFESGEFQN